MNDRAFKDRFIFFSTLAVSAVVFGMGIGHLTAARENQNPISSIADVSTQVAPPSLPPDSTSTDAGSTVGTPSGTASTSMSVATSVPSMVNLLNAVTSASDGVIGETSTSSSTTPAGGSSSSSTPAATGASILASTSTVSTTIAKALPYSISTFGNGDGWATLWGNVSNETGSLVIGSSTSAAGGGAFFSGADLGTDAWSNYDFQATLDWLNGGTFGLIAWYQNNQNYVACEFSEAYVGDIHMSLEQHINGNVVTLAEGDAMDYYRAGGSGIAASIKVWDSRGTCSLNGYVVTNAVAGPQGHFAINPPFRGGIGVTTWNSALNSAENYTEVTVKSIDVTAITGHPG